MADLTQLTSLVTLLKTITVQPDGSKRPLILINGQEPADDSSGSEESGTVTILQKLDYGELNKNVLKTNDRVVYLCEYGKYLVDATTTYADYVDVKENIQSVFRANNAGNVTTFYYYTETFEDLNQITPRVEFLVEIIRKQVTASS